MHQECFFFIRNIIFLEDFVSVISTNDHIILYMNQKSKNEEKFIHIKRLLNLYILLDINNSGIILINMQPEMLYIHISVQFYLFELIYNPLMISFKSSTVFMNFYYNYLLLLMILDLLSLELIVHLKYQDNNQAIKLNALDLLLMSN